ncbi:redox-regulated ATPase YchF [bacterium]|nr:redox-regulated ATPase YchF [bacterium]
MKSGIIGLALSGKSTIFEALSGSPARPELKAENRRTTVTVPDERIDRLSAMYKPRKTIYATIEFMLPGRTGSTEHTADSPVWNAVRDCDALIHVIRNFPLPGMDAPDVAADFQKMEQELIFADLVVVEKRLEKIAAEHQRNRPVDKEEEKLLEQCRELLEQETPLRRRPEIAGAPQLRGYAFLSGRPMLVVFNNPESNNELPDAPALLAAEKCLVIRGGLEHEIAQMSGEDEAAFREEYGISETAVARLIRETYDLLGLRSFFTVGEDEVRAWTITRGTVAVDAAEKIHSDIKQGFIRAETVSYDHLMEAGSHAGARKQGTVRLEGKTYEVQDGDIIDFRFNV